MLFCHIQLSDRRVPLANIDVIMKKIDILHNKMLQDMVLNIISTAIPIAVLQLIIYPVVAKSLGSEAYGFMLTVYSIWIMIPNSLGAVLNNIRLLHNDKYGKEKIGDFAVIYRRWSCISAAVVFIAIWVYSGGVNPRHLFLGMIVSFLLITRIYLEVGFRLEFNYKKILACNLFQSMGFIAGGLVCYYTDIWESIYLFGYGFGCIYAILNTRLFFEKPFRSGRYKKVLKDSYNLAASVIINSLTGYADKLILYPLMGGTAVSIYYTATILGKIASLLTTPINGVILNYIANWKDDNKNIFGKALVVTSALAMCGYGATLLLGHPVIGLLFPQWVDDVMIYLPITTLTVMIGLVASVLQPFVMKFCAMKWQTIINGSAAGIYFFSALFLWRRYELMGFCIGTVIGVTIRLVLLIAVYYISRIRHERNDSKEVIE